MKYIIAFALLCFAWCCYCQETQTLYSIKDAEIIIASYSGRTTNGNGPQLSVGSYHHTASSMITFSLRSLPADANIVAASFSINDPTMFFAINIPESRASLTVNEPGTTFEESQVNSGYIPPPTYASYYDFFYFKRAGNDVTSIVKFMFANDANKEITFRLGYDNDNVFWRSREVLPQGASLQITYETQSTRPICNNQPYFSGTHYCCSNALVCRLGDGCCPNPVNQQLVCFSPITHQCCEGRVLCGKNDACCGNVCYDPSSYICNAQQQIIPK